jgi:proteasome lid subunit RPN8/RPN11
MSSEAVIIPRKIANQLLHAAQIEPEREVCGLLGARGGVVSQYYPVQNRDAYPECRFLLDARQHIDAMRDMRERGEQLFAIYHSHPSAPAEPSPADLEAASYPEALHLIISLNTKGVLEMRGFRLKPPEIREVELVMSED